MQKILFLNLFLVIFNFSFSQAFYAKAYGDPRSRPVIFLHGGPGYNSASFEATTAQKLADSNFFVIVYDRRGEGRSKDLKAKYNFRETFDDIELIYKFFSLKKASFIGHSFGGVLATLFAEKYPGRVDAVFLVGAPISLQQSFQNIINRSKEMYSFKKDSTNLKYIALLEKMDTASLEYSTYCLSHAMQNGFYSPKKQSDEMKMIYAKFRKDTLIQYASQMGYQAPQGFWKNEHYTTIDLTNSVKNVISKKVKLYGFYGKEDGLYSTAQVATIENLLGKENVLYLDKCSHNVFIDQQSIFIHKLKEWIQ